MRIADSSFLIALFSSGDRFYRQAEAEGSQTDPILVASEVLAETLGVFQRRKGIDFARLTKAWLESKPHFRVVFTQRSHYDAASRIFASSPERLNYVDALVIAWCLSEGAKVLTYDEDLKGALKRASS